MLDGNLRHFVDAGVFPKSVLDSWAKENAMMLADEITSLPGHQKVYELSTSNDDLAIKTKLLGSGRPKFVNGERQIGHVIHGDDAHGAYAIICPTIRDR